MNSFGVSLLAFVRDSPLIHTQSSGIWQSSICSLCLQISSCFTRSYTRLSLTGELALGSMSHLGDRLLFIISHQYFSALFSCHLLQYFSALLTCSWQHYFCLQYFFPCILWLPFTLHLYILISPSSRKSAAVYIALTHPFPIHYIFNINIWHFTSFIGVWNFTLLYLSCSLIIMAILTAIFQVVLHFFMSLFTIVTALWYRCTYFIEEKTEA